MALDVLLGSFGIADINRTTDMTTVLDRLGAETKSFLKSLPFSRSGEGGYGYGFNSSYGCNLNSALPGAGFDYEGAAGIFWQNTSAAACFVALTRAIAQSTPYLEEKNGDKWERVDAHPLIDLLDTPNEGYGGDEMFGATTISTMSYGRGFWRIERTRGGVPAKLWYEPPAGLGPTGIIPNWDTTNFIKNYIYIVDGRRYEVDLEDVIMFRYGLDPANTRNGWAPLALASREIATLNGASTFTAAVLRNGVAPSGALVMEGAANVGSQAPTTEQAEEARRLLTQKFTAEGVGKPFVSNFPWKWIPLTWSPAEMTIDRIRQWPQGTVCALLSTPEIVAGLPTGEQPTYENLNGSYKNWWETTVIPIEDSYANKVKQLFPAFGLDPKKCRVSWDRSRVVALQEDMAKKFAMWADLYKAGGCDRYTLKTNLSIEAEETDKELYHPLATPKDPNAEPEPEIAPADIQKANRLDAARGRKSLESRFSLEGIELIRSRKLAGRLSGEIVGSNGHYE